MRYTHLKCILSLMLLSCVVPSLAATTLQNPIYAEFYLRSGDEKIAGNVTQWDDNGFTIHQAKNDRDLKWSDLTGPSAFTLRSRVIDKSSAADWLGLGEMGWKSGVGDQARAALVKAEQMDATLKPRAEQILSTVPGGPKTRVLIARGMNHSPTSAPVKYVKSTPEQDAAAIARAQKVAASMEELLHLKFTELQTPHFILFTDWDPREFTFLKTNVEAAYSAVSRQFDIPVKENVFIGKLPVFMFAKQNDFQKYSQEIDELPPTAKLLGYYAGHGDGTGHMAMWKPRQQIADLQGQNPEEQWAYTLTHEFTHAFVDRYRSSRHIPRWLNEGLAEVIAQTQFPQPGRRIFARQMAVSDANFDFLFDDDQMPSGEFYPVMQTMVEMLIAQNRKAFLQYFDAIKDGENPEAALKRIYGVDYPKLVVAWRQFIMRG